MDAAFEPFVERIVTEFAQRADGLFMIGYRSRESSRTVASFILPGATLGEALALEFELSARVTASGRLICSLADRVDGVVAKAADVDSIEKLVATLLTA